MNVAFDPWIPVVTVQGVPCRISLFQALTEGDRYADLAVRPHERVALMRLLVCAAHAVIDGPKDETNRENVSENLSRMAENYFMEWKDSFEIFHKAKPWLQIPGIKPNNDSDDANEGWQSVSKLAFYLASGSNSTLFDHEGVNRQRQIYIKDTLVSMLAFQCFSPGGLISQVNWHGVKTNKSSKDGPCVPSSMVHTLIRGNNLLETLCANMPAYSTIHRSMQIEIGKPVWEQMPESFQDKANISNATQTYLGRLVPLKRLILLNQKDNANTMLLGDGLEYPGFNDDFVQEPTATVVLNNKQERILLAFRPNKGVWRELPALLVKRTGDKNSPGGSLAINFLKEDRDCDLVVSGLARDQANILDTAEFVYHIPSSVNSVDGLDEYEKEVSYAESVAVRLSQAIEGYRKTIDPDWESRLKKAGAKKYELMSKLCGVASNCFWTSVEANLNLLMGYIEAKASNTGEFESKQKEWRKLLMTNAEELYTTVCGHETPRQAKAFVKGWEVLHRRSKKPDNENQTQESA